MQGVSLHTHNNEGVLILIRVLLAASSVHLTHSHLFRTYKSRRSSLYPTIVEALCSTMATPPPFPAVNVGPRLRERSFVGGALGANNPTKELLKEAQAIFGKDRRIAQIISLGSGLPRVISLEDGASQKTMSQFLRRIIADCEVVAADLSTRLFDVGAYLRLNVDRGMDDIEIGDWNRLASIESHTWAYVEGTIVSRSIDNSLKNIRERTGSANLGQISQAHSYVTILTLTHLQISPRVLKLWLKRRRQYRPISS